MIKEYEYEMVLNNALSRVPDNLDKREGSVIYTTLAPVCFELSRAYWLLSWLLDLVFPDTSWGEWLDKCTRQFGLERKQATQALRKVTVTDDDGLPMEVPLDSRFRCNDITLVIKELIEGGYSAEVEQSGLIGNQYQGELIPISNIPSLGTALLQGVLVEAKDAETDEELRSRYYEHVRKNPFGGNVADYEDTVMSIEGIGAVKVFPTPENEAGKVLIIIGSESERNCSPELVNQVQDLFQPETNPQEGLAPIGHIVQVKTSTSFSVNISAVIKVKEGDSFAVIQQRVIQGIHEYLDSILFKEATIFHSRVMVAILNVEGVIDVSALSLNGESANLNLSKNAESYEVPEAGTIVVTQAVS